MITELRDALLNLTLCFGHGPESEDWWENWIDNMACDCVNPDHCHNAAAIRDLMLDRARALLARERDEQLPFVGTAGATVAPIGAVDALSPDSVEAQVVARLTEHEAVDAAAVFHELLKRDDPYALTRTIEHVLKMRSPAIAQ